MILFSIEAILFYIPRWLWKNWEAGKVSALRMDLNCGVQSETDKKLKKKLLLDYLYSNLKQHNFWAYRYFFCEFLAFITVTGGTILQTVDHHFMQSLCVLITEKKSSSSPQKLRKHQDKRNNLDKFDLLFRLNFKLFDEIFIQQKKLRLRRREFLSIVLYRKYSP